VASTFFAKMLINV